MHKESFLARFGFLHEAYAADMWFGELIECARKVIMVGAIMFVFPGTPTQTAIAFAVAYIFLAYQLRFR